MNGCMNCSSLCERFNPLHAYRKAARLSICCSVESMQWCHVTCHMKFIRVEVLVAAEREMRKWVIISEVLYFRHYRSVTPCFSAHVMARGLPQGLCAMMLLHYVKAWLALDTHQHDRPYTDPSHTAGWRQSHDALLLQ